MKKEIKPPSYNILNKKINFNLRVDFKIRDGSFFILILC